MEKLAWRARVKDGCMPEYIKRHTNILQQLKDTLKQAGIKNYSIWQSGNELFGYYECEKSKDFALNVQKASDVVAKWNEYMKDILIMEIMPDGGQPQLVQIFNME